MPYTYNLGNWNEQFLKDIGAPDTAANKQYLTQWENREGATGFAFNPLATMQQGYGGTPGTNGIMSYPTLQAGAAADAAALSNGRYNDLLAAFRSGNPDPSNTYSGELSTWSGGGYANLAGASTNVPGVVQNIQNQPGVTAAQQNQGLIDYQIANAQLLASQNAQYAQQETGFQQQLLGLSQQGLGIQQGALQRQQVLDPKLYGIEQQQYGLSAQQIAQSRADIQRQGAQQVHGEISSNAASGNLFTAGGREGLANTRANIASALKSNDIQRQGLGLSEKQSALTFNEQMAALRDQQKNLNLTAQRYGISAEELQARLQNSLQNINEGNISTILGYQQEGLQNSLQLGQILTSGLPLGAYAGVPQNTNYIGVGP